jgi:hypothetical protein
VLSFCIDANPLKCPSQRANGSPAALRPHSQKPWLKSPLKLS